MLIAPRDSAQGGRSDQEPVAHYGSAAAEIAVCLKAVGLVERGDLRLLAVTGDEPYVEQALAAAVPGAVPTVGSAVCVADTWCCRVAPDRAVVAGEPGAVDRWRSVVGRVVATTSVTVEARLLPAADAVSIVGPRAAALMTASSLPADLPPSGVATARLADSPVVVVHEDADRFLLLFTDGCSPASLEAIGDRGRVAGLARVGHEALAHLRAARRPAPALH